MLKNNEEKILQIVSEKKGKINLIIKEKKKKILLRLVENGTELSIEGVSDRVEVLALFIIRKDNAAASSSTAGDEKVYTYKVLSKSRRTATTLKLLSIC